MYKKIWLRKGKEESLRRFHPWVFSGAIQRMDEGIEEGELVRVMTISGDSPPQGPGSPARGFPSASPVGTALCRPPLVYNYTECFT